MASDEDIVWRLREILTSADLTTTTVGAIRRQMEEELGIDLSDKKAFIRSQVDLFLQSQQEAQAQEVEGEEEVVDQEVEEEEEEEEEEEDGHQNSDSSGKEPDTKRFKAKINRAIKDSQIELAINAHVTTDSHKHVKIDWATKESLQKDKKKRVGGGGGLNKSCGLSPVLQELIGEAELPRTQVVKQLWEYIRKHNLQDPKNKRRIICDDALRNLFGTESTDMFQMNKLLSKHIWPLEGARDGEPKPKKPKPDKSDKSDKKEGGKGKASGFQTPFSLSKALMDFLGTGEKELPLSELVKRIWEYIKANDLQSPQDKRIILCDQKLQELFGCDNFVGFGMTKLIKPHISKDGI